MALNRSQPSEKACFRGQNGIRCGMDQYCRVVWTWNALLSVRSDKAALTAGGKEFFRTLGKKSQRAFNGRKTCMHLSERLWSKQRENLLCSLYICPCPLPLKQAVFVTEVQSQPVCCSHPSNFWSREAIRNLKSATMQIGLRAHL